MNKIYVVLSFLLIIFVSVYLIKDLPSRGTFQESDNSLFVKGIKEDLDQNSDFYGEKGEKVSFEDEKILIPTSTLIENQVKYYHTELNGKKIYFMIVKDKNETYRAAANACEVCFSGHMGFRQEGNFVICNNCQNRFPLSDLGVVKGGCNPGPINSDITVKNQYLILEKGDLEKVVGLF